jgi:serine/threonine protein kinase
MNKINSTSSNQSTDNNSSLVSSSSDEELNHNNNIDLHNKILRHYNIIYELGKGGSSIVWLAYNNINNSFVALKVQDSDLFIEGLDEIKFVKKLPKDPPIFNNLIEYFIEYIENKKYLCSVWHLHCFNIDTLIRKCYNNNGLELNIVKKIMKTLINAIYILHKKFKVFHGDIKTDNILIKGITNKNKIICENYIKFFNEYKNNNLNNNINHINILNNIKNIINENIEDHINLNNIDICLSDFGSYCEIDKIHTNTFGTRYYQAPEIILYGKCSFPVDIWALGCTFYELLSGKILFDPIKDKNGSRDYYHLQLINDTCGNFPSSFLLKTKKYNNFFKNYKLINYISPNINRLDDKLNLLNLSQYDKIKIKDILNKMLIIDPKKRITIDELTKEIFFNN